MITAALNTVTVSPRRYIDNGEVAKLAALSSEIAERLEEMHEIQWGAGLNLVHRLSTMAKGNGSVQGPDQFNIAVAILHGNIGKVLDSYAVQGDDRERSKQVVFHQVRVALSTMADVFPEAATAINQIRESVKHHEDPQSAADVVRGAME